MRKLIATLLALIMLSSLSIPALAAEDESIDVYAKYIQNIEGEYTAAVVNGGASAVTPNGTVAVFNAPANAATLVVIPMKGDALAWIDGCVDADTVAAFDIHFLDADGNRINANGAKVSIAVSGTELTVSSVTTTGTDKQLISEVSDGKVTFTTDGSHYYVIAAHVHSFTDKASNVKAADATCTEAATYYVQCDNCSEYTTEKTVPVGEPLGHDWDEGTVTTKPTCEKDGVRTFTCKRDSSHTYTKAEPATGHSFTKYESNNDATCKKDATETAKCDHGCGETDTRTDKGSKLGHKYEDGKCVRCGASQWIPETGDNSNIFLWAGILLLSAVALFFLFFWKRRKKENETA